MSKLKKTILKFDPDALSKDKELLDSISLVTAIFTHTTRRPAVRGAFFAILKATATLLLAEDKKYPIALALIDKDAIEEGYGAPVPTKKVVPAKKKARVRGK